MKDLLLECENLIQELILYLPDGIHPDREWAKEVLQKVSEVTNELE